MSSAEDAAGNNSIKRKRADINIDNINPDFDIVLNKTHFQKDETVIVEVLNYTETNFNVDLNQDEQAPPNGITVLEKQATLADGTQNNNYTIASDLIQGFTDPGNICLHRRRISAGNNSIKRAYIQINQN